MKALSVKRQADRREMTLQVMDLALLRGCLVKRIEGGVYPGPRCTQLELQAPGGVCITVSFDGDSGQPDVYVLSWHMALDSDAKLDSTRFGGSVNPHHFRKATYVAHGFVELLEQLNKGLTMAQDGTAYQHVSEAVA